MTGSPEPWPPSGARFRPSGGTRKLNGHSSHQSARYQLTTPDGRGERHSSSGLIVSTGTGATGWCASIALDAEDAPLPAPKDSRLAWFVREAWPSPSPELH